MKVLIVSHENDLSGANKSMIGIIKELKKKVTFVVVVNSKKGELVNELVKLGIEIIYCKYSWWFAHSRSFLVKRIYRKMMDAFYYYKNRLFYRIYMKELSKKKFDLVYTNTSTIDFGAYIAYKLKLPHLWHIREFGEEDFGFQKICLKTYYKKVFNRAAEIIVISQAVKKKYSKSIFLPAIKVIYNGFNIKKLIQTIYIHDMSKVVKILITGQVSEAKCQRQAIMACEILIRKGINLELHLAGMVDKDYLKKSLVVSHNYKWLIIHGQVNNIFELRKEMDIELICSRNEAFGRVTIEAMLHGLPVIGANTGGTEELIQDKETGLLYEFGNIYDLAEKIEKLIIDKNLYFEIAEKAQKYARKFTIEKTASSIYREFLNNI